MCNLTIWAERTWTAKERKVVAMTTKLQETVMFWQGLATPDEQLPDDPSLDELVTLICQLLCDVPTYKNYAKIGFKVWRNGKCWGLNGGLSDYLGEFPKLSQALYGSEQTLQALHRRGAKEGFRIRRKTDWTRSLVIMFVPPE
jgi:hypothetical protein